MHATIHLFLHDVGSIPHCSVHASPHAGQPEARAQAILLQEVHSRRQGVQDLLSPRKAMRLELGEDELIVHENLEGARLRQVGRNVVQREAPKEQHGLVLLHELHHRRVVLEAQEAEEGLAHEQARQEKQLKIARDLGCQLRHRWRRIDLRRDVADEGGEAGLQHVSQPLKVLPHASGGAQKHADLRRLSHGQVSRARTHRQKREDYAKKQHAHRSHSRFRPLKPRTPHDPFARDEVQRLRTA
mmetsp:Transcript_3244/g.12984  ORF Transcript_3244/g.12984 Transcript_3244/m.12984 type:complete len:243 (+) Transcript_3244:123-851(+)